MGVKLSKLIKRSYVVSEGVQTDLSIQACDELFDSKSFNTPPRDVQHLCDPRSISRGIVRTPIMCQIHEEILTPVMCKKKPYLETNLDDLPPAYHPPNPCDHLIEIDEKASPVAEIHPRLNDVSRDITNSLSNFEESHISQSCKIEMIENEKTEMLGNVSCNNSFTEVDDDFLKPGYVKDFKIDLMTTEESSIFEPFEKVIEKGKLLNCPFRIDSSETVEQVCQKILDELLDSKDDLHVDDVNDSEEELFVDGNISDIVESMKNLCINQSGSSFNRITNKMPHGCDENCVTPTSSKFVSKSYHKAALTNFQEQSWISGSPKKRKPLGEVNSNIQQNRPLFNAAKLNQEIVNSPLKSMLPLLPSQVSAPPVKSHRSNWDGENTLII